ncbi:MAG: hypothetical protein K2K30_04715, partial [Alistipes sp.]|nr:hypothetical protein [Alistipes sp.]
MKGYARLLFAIAAVALSVASCGKDDETDTSSLSFDSAALYFTQAGESQRVAVSAQGVNGLNISSTPEGWTATFDAATQSVTVTAPEDLSESENETSGSVVLAGTSYLGTSKTATLFVGITETVSYTQLRAPEPR